MNDIQTHSMSGKEREARGGKEEGEKGGGEGGGGERERGGER